MFFIIPHKACQYFVFYAIFLTAFDNALNCIKPFDNQSTSRIFSDYAASIKHISFSTAGP